ncbi:hypothetical protein OH76DRAFT_1303222, partial [Lentinus brumalis]
AASESSPAVQQSNKKQKTSGDGEASAGSADEATDGGIPAAAARVRRATKTRLLSGEEKRTRFLAKYPGMSPEEILDAIACGWRSNVYGHYKAPKVVRLGNGAIMHRFVCKRYPSKHIDRADYEDSTGNLKRHVDLCDPDETPESEAISAFAHGATYSPARLRFLIAMWCAARHRPFAIVDDPEFQEMLRMLYGKVKLPS